MGCTFILHMHTGEQLQCRDVLGTLTAFVFIESVQSDVADLQVRELSLEVVKGHPALIHGED